jgi:hypothetical protein
MSQTAEQTSNPVKEKEKFFHSVSVLAWGNLSLYNNY